MNALTRRSAAPIRATCIHPQRGFASRRKNRTTRSTIVSPVPSTQPSEHTVLGFEVNDVDFVVRSLSARSLSFERFEGFPHEESGVMKTPDGTRVAWFRDPDGNLLSIVQFPADGCSPTAVFRDSSQRWPNLKPERRVMTQVCHLPTAPGVFVSGRNSAPRQDCLVTSQVISSDLFLTCR
jgi:hypothetical protein